MFKLGKFSASMTLFTEVLFGSMAALQLLLFFLSVGMVLFGSAIYFFETPFYDAVQGIYIYYV